MRFPSWLLPAEILLLVGSLQLFPQYAGAVPSINIGLKASFDSAPYLVELLETAGDENEAVYFKILDRIAQGYFNSATTDQELYEKFVRLLKSDGLITNPEALAAFNFALSIHNAAPRIEAHYQYYRTAIQPLLEKSKAKDCETWLEFNSRQFCSPQLEKEDARIAGLAEDGSENLPFDRQFGEGQVLPATVYADITTAGFRQFHPLLQQSAENGRIKYRIRHKPSKNAGKSVEMSGFGAELALKRTDYIVIDDRNAEGTDTKAEEKPGEGILDEEEDMADLKPLSSSDLLDLPLKAATYVMNSDYPLKRLLKITQDFPKYASFLAGQEVSEPLKKEHAGNREKWLPAGFNVIFINGVQYDTRKVDPFSILDHMKRERNLLGAVKELGFDNAEAVQLLSHPAIAAVQQDTEVPRYDWRDRNEGGNVIIWLNDIENDKRYEDWPEGLMALLQRTYPGQMPMVKKDIHNAIIPVDLSDTKSIALVVGTLQDFVKRKIPVRFGIVPITSGGEASISQTLVAYHIYESYGLGALIAHLDSASTAKTLSVVHEKSFKQIIQKRKLKPEKEERSLQQVLESTDGAERIKNAANYLGRLGARGTSAPMFINGVPIKNDDEWLQTFSQRISLDLRVVQRAVFEGTLEDTTWIPEIWLAGSAMRRNAIVIPEDEKDVKVLNLVKVFNKWNTAAIKTVPTIPATDESNKGLWSQLIVAGDFDTDQGIQLFLEALKFRREHENVEVLFVYNGFSPIVRSPRIVEFWPRSKAWTSETVQSVYRDVKALLKLPTTDRYEGTSYWPELAPFVETLGLKAGESGLILNGRKIAPIDPAQAFTKEDFETLYGYELRKRIKPTADVVADLGLGDKLQTPLDAAKLSSLLVLSTISDMPEGIFELPPPVRTRLFHDWDSTYTAITVGDNSTAAIQVVALIDPASETAQRWVPILKTLSELDGIYMQIFLNPREMLQELPVKRFYRYALSAKPTFDGDGAGTSRGVQFDGIPKDALLTAGLDVPSSWLVAPQDSIHDLDNIKLSSLKTGANVDATYELESIMIEGHSRDTKQGVPPRGAQLVLSTAKDPQLADTIIMANLGYFQFKASPGLYNITLLPGASQKIFNIDSLGTLGYSPVPGDETTEVALLSFQGVTLYPRLSRKPGMEEEDVLEMPKTDGLASMGANLLSKVGVKKVASSPHADINIFSVASGHLYERMLSIMMLSVMKNTKHTVKFWFIEQFLSSSFKAFLPKLAEEYGFQFELVTYKWPHWLRAQKEKQREIWGYKILFLDVLFPLDLDKVIFVDADQIVRTDMIELVNLDLLGAPYGFTPMCDSRTEMEGFRFWKQGYWKNFLRGKPYHISALYVVDLKKFRSIAAGDRLRGQYHQLSADPNSLSNLDQDLPNNMQMVLPIHSLPQEWLWCETWCSDESLRDAKTIDLCNNPQTKEPKLERARRQVPEWTEYDDEIAALARRTIGEVVTGEEQMAQQKAEEVEKKAEKKAETGGQEQQTDSQHKRDEL